MVVNSGKMVADGENCGKMVGLRFRVGGKMVVRWWQMVENGGKMVAEMVPDGGNCDKMVVRWW